MPTRHVNTVVGLDTGSRDGSLLQPWATITYAVANSPATDTVLLARNQTHTTAGLISAAVSRRFGAYAGGPKPVWDVSGNAHAALALAANVIVEEIHFKGSQGTGTTVDLVVCSGGVNVDGAVLRWCTFEGGKHALSMDGTSTGKVTVTGATATWNWLDGFSINGVGDRLALSFFTISGTGRSSGGLENPDVGAGDAITAHDTGYFTASYGRIASCLRGMVNINTAGTNLCDHVTFYADASTTREGVAVQMSGGTTILRSCAIIADGSQVLSAGADYDGIMVYQHVSILSRNTNAATCFVSAGKNSAGDAGTVPPFRASGVVTMDNVASYVLNGAHKHANFYVGAGGAASLSASPRGGRYYPDGASAFSYGGLTGNFALWQATGDNGAIANPAFDGAASGTGAEAVGIQTTSPCVGVGADLGTASDSDIFGKRRRSAYGLGAPDSGAAEADARSGTALAGSFTTTRALAGSFTV